MKSIKPLDCIVEINEVWKNKWFLLTSGNFDKNHFNAMTISWGFFGVMWNKAMAVIAVAPSRFTYEFLEKYDSFTLATFPEKYKKDLFFLGALSGRDMDKKLGSDLTPSVSSLVSAPSYKEADLILECKKVYWDDVKPENFVETSIFEKNYEENDYHRLYYAEVVKIKDNGNKNGG